MSAHRKCYMKKFLILTVLQIIINVGIGKNVAAGVSSEDSGQTKEQTDISVGKEVTSAHTREEGSTSESKAENSNQLEGVVDNKSKAKEFTDTLAYSQELVEDIAFFHNQLDKRVEAKLSGWIFNFTEECFKVEVRRSNILEDTFKRIAEAYYNQLMAKNFQVDFIGERKGALAAPQEWLTRLSDEIFNPKSKYFKYTNEDSHIYTLQIRPMEAVEFYDEKFFYFVGRVIGIAIYRGYRIHVYLSELIYKKILGKEIELNDVKEVDRQFYKSLSWIMENDQSSSDADFVVEEEDEFGNKFSHNLNPSGEPLKLDESNKKEFVNLYIQWKFAPEKQTSAFLRGLHGLIPLDLLRESFSRKELEILLCGIHELNIEEWRDGTYVNKISSTPPYSEFIDWFWNIVKEFDYEKRAKLLEYVTGSRSLPVGGFKALKPLFTIGLTRFDKSTEVILPPRAQTWLVFPISYENV